MNKTIEKYAPKFVELIAERLNNISENWEKPFFSVPQNTNYLPQNIRGNIYRSSNAFFLFLLCEKMQYVAPVFLTFNQARDMNLSINKGSKSFPVKYKSFSVVHKETKKKISLADWKLLSKEQREEYNVFSSLRYYNVFNIEDTNYSEVYPNEWEEMVQKFDRTIKFENEVIGYDNSYIETMIENKSWLCNISFEVSNTACYSSFYDKVSMPLKEQFKDAQGFYSTLLHEMSHSTGHYSRLDRKLANPFGTEAYAHEELIAEISAAMTGIFTGVSVKIREQNIAYIASWLQKFNSDPQYLYNVIEDASRASMLICENLKIDEEVEVLEMEVA